MIFPLIIAAAVAAAGKLRKGNAEKQQAEYNAKVDERNAAIARDSANAAALAQQRSSQKVIGGMRAAYGAAGVTVDGSPLDVLEDSAGQAELDRLNILHNGELTAIGQEDAATLQRYIGQQRQQAGYFDAAGSIFNAFGAKGGPMGNS